MRKHPSFLRYLSASVALLLAVSSFVLTPRTAVSAFSISNQQQQRQRGGRNAFVESSLSLQTPKGLQKHCFNHDRQLSRIIVRLAGRQSPVEGDDLKQQQQQQQPEFASPLDPEKRGKRGPGGYNPYEKFGGREINVGDPQLKVEEKERSVTSILQELAAIQRQGPRKYCILGTRHCSFLHQQIIELLAYALVLSGNHVYTSGAGGTNAATIRGALRAACDDLLTVVLPQSMGKQTAESQELLANVKDVIAMPQNDDMSLDVASRICNSYLLSQTDQLISFAFHESNTVIEATKEAKKLDMVVTVLYLD